MLPGQLTAVAAAAGGGCLVLDSVSCRVSVTRHHALSVRERQPAELSNVIKPCCHADRRLGKSSSVFEMVMVVWLAWCSYLLDYASDVFGRSVPLLCFLFIDVLHCMVQQLGTVITIELV